MKWLNVEQDYARVRIRGLGKIGAKDGDAANVGFGADFKCGILECHGQLRCCVERKDSSGAGYVVSREFTLVGGEDRKVLPEVNTVGGNYCALRA